MKILNLYAGIGGNRKLWEEENDITAVELMPEIAKIYQDFYPKDKVIVADAHQYLLDHFGEYDFIWSSPPCPTHSRANNFLHSQGLVRYPDMSLWQEVIFLKHRVKAKWVVENVVSYYEPMYSPIRIDRHYFWSNFPISPYKMTRTFNAISGAGRKGEKRESAFEEMQKLQKHHGITIEHYSHLGTRQKTFLLRNCIEPELGQHILESAE